MKRGRQLKRSCARFGGSHCGIVEGKLMSNVGKNKRNDAPVQSPEPLHPGIARAREQLSKGESDGAAVTLRQLVKQPDLTLNTRVEAAKLLNSAGAQADAINVYLEIGRKALEAGDVAAARTSLSAAHTLDQKNYDALFELGRADLAEGKREEALAKFVEVLRKSNLRHLPALYEAAVLYEADGQSDQAILAYKKIAERDRHHVPTLTRLATMHRKKGQLGEALGYYIAGARAAVQTMHYAEARKLVDEALQIEDDNWEARRLLADINKAEPEAAPAKPPPAAAPARPVPLPAAAQPARPVNIAPPPQRPPVNQPAAQPRQPAAPTAPPVRPAAPPVQAQPGPGPAPAAPPQPTQQAVPPAQQTVQPAPQAAQPVQQPAARPVPPPAAASAPPSNAVSPPPAQESEKNMPPEDIDLELPPEMALLEKQSEVTAKLAQITAEVAEAYKKRVAIERELKAALAALEALNTQKNGVEGAIADLKQQLDGVAQTKAAEDKALADVRTKLETSRSDLEKLAELPEFVNSIESKSSAVATLISNASATLETAQRRVGDAQANAAAVEKTASELIARMGAARQQAEDATEQLSTVLQDAKAAKTDVTAAAAAVVELKTTVGGLQALKAQVDAARAELKSLSPLIEAKRAQASAALGQLATKQAARDGQFQAAATQVNAVASGGAPPPIAAPAPKVPAPQAAPAPSRPAAAGQAKGAPVTIDTLLLQGRLDDALRAAREAANGSPDPDAKLIEAAERLREAGNAAPAAKAYEKLISAGNTGADARLGLARSYVSLRRFKEAMPLFDAISEPELAVLRECGIGQCLRGLNRADEAAQHFSKALEIPGHPDTQYREVLYNLADLYESRGDGESLNLALWSFEEIQAGAPDYRDVGDRITTLKERLAKIVVPEPKPVLTRDAQSGRDGRF